MCREWEPFGTTVEYADCWVIKCSDGVVRITERRETGGDDIGLFCLVVVMCTFLFLRGAIALASMTKSEFQQFKLEVWKEIVAIIIRIKEAFTAQIKAFCNFCLVKGQTFNDMCKQMMLKWPGVCDSLHLRVQHDHIE